MEASRRCLVFGLLQVCDGDIVIIEMTRGDVVRGVVRIPERLPGRLVFISLATDCNAEPAESISIRRIARIIKIGRCEG